MTSLFFSLWSALDCSSYLNICGGHSTLPSIESGHLDWSHYDSKLVSLLRGEGVCVCVCVCVCDKWGVCFCLLEDLIGLS